MNNPDTKINERNLSNVVNTVISTTAETSIIRVSSVIWETLLINIQGIRSVIRILYR